MKKNFSANLLFLLLLNLLVKPFYVFGIEVGVQNAVGPEEYGLYYAMFNFTFLFNVLLDMGINNFQKIKVAENSESGMGNMAALIPLKIWLTILYFIVTIGAGLALGFEGRYWYFIGWLMVNHVLLIFLLLLRANLSGLHLFLRDSIVSVIDRTVLVLGIGYVLWFGSEQFKIETFVLFQTGSYVIGILFALGFTPSEKRFPKLNFSRTAALGMMRKTWPFALLILLMTAYSKLDGVMLERLAADGLVEAGIYAQAYRIIDAGNSFAFLYAGMLLPIFARMIDKNKPSELSVMINQAARFLIMPAGIAAIVVLNHSEWMMAALYDYEVAGSSASFSWLMGSFLFVCVGYVFGTFMTANHQLRRLNWIAFIAVLINLVLNYLFIPEVGAEGAAIASFVSLAFMAMSQIASVFSKVKGLEWRWLIPTLSAWGFLVTVSFGLDQIQVNSGLSFIIMCGLGVLSFTFLGLKKKDLKTLIPEEDALA